MKLQQQNVLFFTRTMKIGGTENIVLQLCEMFKPLVKKVVVCSCGGVNVEKLVSMGIRHYVVPDIEKKSLKNILYTISILEKIVYNENITVIHTHHRMAAFYVSLLRLYKRCVFINTSHNTFDNKKILTKFAYKHAKLVVCGEVVKANLINIYGLPDGQVTVVRNAVKPFDNSIVKNPLLSNLKNNGYFLVGNVGRLSKQKGMEYFIKSIPMVIIKCPQARFLIIGSGENEAKLRALAADLKVTGYLHFMGYHSDIQNLMSQLDLIVLSSLWEGLPLTPIEAFSVRKTIIATRVDGTIEIVNNNENGLLVEPKDSIQIAQRIVFMIKHEDERRRMEMNAQICYFEKFSYKNFSDRYIEYYIQTVEIPHKDNRYRGVRKCK